MTLLLQHLGRQLGALAVLVLAGLAADADATDRPRVGLVLGGGGARGAAHIGVLEVLEELRVPVDCVAGTSMGALVAGAWVAGVSPGRMRREMAKADWIDMFQDNPEFSELSFRNKRQSQRFLPGSETGVSERGVQFPPGVVLGQKIKLFFNSLVHADYGEREIQQLGLPLSIIATDIGTGEKVVFRDGSLTTAMRASMSVPGLLAPVEYRGRKLVDGGLVDNVPLDEVRNRCQAEVIIAVNVGSPLLKPEEVGSLLSVSAQMVNILTEQNVARSLATLAPGDVYIKPDLEGISASAFDRNGEAADRGRRAAEAMASQLARLSVEPWQFAKWQTEITAGTERAPRIDEIEIVGLGRVDPEAVKPLIRQKEGEPLDTARLNEDLLRIFGDGHYQSVDYTLLTTRERNILRVVPVEKEWGPSYLRLGVNLEIADQGANFDLRLGYQRTMLNRLGGEVLITGQIGSRSGLGIDFYQPLDPAQTFFIEPIAGMDRRLAPIYDRNQKVAEYKIRTAVVEFGAGVNVARLGQIRAGWLDKTLRGWLETGSPIFPTGQSKYDGPFVGLDFDQMNRLYFPTQGWSTRLRYFSSGGPDGDFSRLDARAEGVVSFGKHVLGGVASYTGSPRGRLPFFDAATLGGFLNMTAFAPGQLVGDDTTYGQLRLERIIGVLPIGLRGDIRVGVALEAARRGVVDSETKLTGWLNSASLYLGGETPLGPVYLGYGYSTSGNWNIYLFLGTP